VLDADDDMNENSLALFDTVGLHRLSIFDGDAMACTDDCEWPISEVDEMVADKSDRDDGEIDTLRPETRPRR